MERRTKRVLVAAWMFVFIVSVSVKAQVLPDVEISDPEFVYDVNANFESGAAFTGKRGSPTTTVTASPVQQVSALFRNTGTKPIKSVTWEYLIFKDAEEKKLLRIYTIHSKTLLLPGESARLGKAGYHLRHSQYEKAKIVRVEYADGTVWLGTKTKG